MTTHPIPRPKPPPIHYTQEELDLVTKLPPVTRLCSEWVGVRVGRVR